MSASDRSGHPGDCAGVPECAECNAAAMLEGFRGEKPKSEPCPCRSLELQPIESAIEV